MKRIETLIGENMRNKLWDFFTRNHPDGAILTRRLRIIRALLFPLDALYWKLSKSRGYQYESDTWVINGVKYSGKALRTLSHATGDVFEITRDNDILVVRRIDNIEDLPDYILHIPQTTILDAVRSVSYAKSEHDCGQ